MHSTQHEMEWTEGGEIRRMTNIHWLRFRRWLNAFMPIGIGQSLMNAASILLPLGLFVWSGPLLRLMDATAGVLDIGILSVLPLVLLVVALARLSAAGMYKLMVEPVNQLMVWQRILCYGCLYLSYFWAVVWVVVSLV